MRISSNSIEKATIILKEPKRILRVLCIGPVSNPIENDIFNCDLNNIFTSNDFIVKEGNNITLKSGVQHKVFYFDKTNESNTGIDFSDYEYGENQRFFIFSNIFSNSNKKVILRFGKIGRLKVWLNNTLIFNGHANLTEENFVLTTVNEGNNLIFVEYFPTSKEQGAVFSICINELGNEATQLENEIMTYYLKQRVEAKIQVIYESCCVHNNSYEFSVIPMDFCNIDRSKSVTISILNSVEMELNNIVSEFYRVISLNKIEYIENMKEDAFLHFKIFYFDKEGLERVQKFSIVSKDYLEYLDEEVNYFDSFLTTLPLNQNQKIFYLGLLNDFKNSGINLRTSIINKNTHMGNIFWVTFFREQLKSILTSKDLTKTIDELLNAEGKGIDIYYKSKLDESIKKYIICIPQNYLTEKKYPLVIYLLPEVWGCGKDHYSLIPSDLSEDVIFASISTRNVTLGSYMGEASILESIEEIKKSYNIDEKRMYIIGYSNGAYACWGLIQAYPHIFAAAAPLSGDLYIKNIKNFIHTPFFSIFGEKDNFGFRELSRELHKWTEKHNNYVTSKVSIFKESDHFTFLPIVFWNKVLIEWLLQHKKQHYDTKSYFRTERIRHNGNEWIQIIDVDKNSKFSEFELEVKNKSHITLSIKNALEFVLRLPDYIDRNNLTITINGQDLLVPKLNGNINLCFSKIKDKYLLSTNANMQSYSSWGMGILDIYMDTLKIVVPSTFSSPDEEDTINQIAHSFSEPKSQGYDPNIDVKYPIIKDFITNNIIEDSNIILIGWKDNNNLFNSIKEKLNIQMNEDGYYYNGKYFNQDYCIIFIQSNPIYPSKKILIVYSNSLKLFKKNIFLRKFIVPSYFNGFHSYLNCEVIIFDGKDISVADVVGGKLYKPLE